MASAAVRPPRPAAAGRATALAAVLIVAAVACALGAWRGGWWVPFVTGVAAGIAGLRAGRGRLWWPRGGVLAATAGAVLGWGFLLWLPALRGEPAGATARVIAALAGVPPYAPVGVAATLLLAAAQVLAGAWLARAAGSVRPDGAPRARR